MISTLMKKGCMSCFFQTNSRRQKTSEDCFNVLFPHVRQELSDKSHAMEIEGLTSRFQAIKIKNETYQ